LPDYIVPLPAEVSVAQLQIERAEALRYLRWPFEKPLPAELAGQLAQAEADILAAAQPRFVYKAMPLQAGPAGLALAGCNLLLAGRDIARLLQNAANCLLLAATLGVAVDELIRRAEIRDIDRALLLDACASAAVENLCEQLQNKLRECFAAQGVYLTARFSPGYGDLPLSCQPQFCAALDTVRSIGLTVSQSGLLLPRKSVTAVIGLLTEPPATAQLTLRHNCAICTLQDCPYRKKDSSQQTL